MLTGRCSCAEVAYEVTAPPLFTHCCHCTWCQRESGSAFALNLVIEKSALRIARGRPEPQPQPTASGRGQTVWRCPGCKGALYSSFSRPWLLFVRVGTLDTPAAVPPDVHIFTSTKLPWVVLPPGARAFDGYYDQRKEWPDWAQARFLAARATADS